MKFLKGIFIICFVLSILIIILVNFALSSKSAILVSNTITAKEAAKAKQLVNELTHQASLNSKNINLSLTTEDLALISNFVSETMPKLAVQMNLSAQQIYAAATYEVEVFSLKKYINLSCIVSQKNNYIGVDECNIGKINIPSSFVEFLVLSLSKQVIPPDQLTHYEKLYQDIAIQNNRLNVNFSDLTEVKISVEKLSKQFFDVTTPFIANSGVDNTQVEFYVNLIQKSELQSHSLAPYLIELFQNVDKYSNKDNLIAENKAALWALVIVFGNKKFAHYLGQNYQLKKGFLDKKIHNRRDLALHFLYSIFLELTGKQYMATKIGEYKELLDSNKGGSGFSFADLAADLTGIKFSKALTSDAVKSRKILQQFAQINNSESLEPMVFPSIAGLPEGMSDAKFTKIYNNVNSDKYKQITQKINQRINQLYIYQ